MAVLEVDLVQPRHADGLVQLADDDHEGPGLLALRELVNEALFGAQRNGAGRPERLRHLGVVEPRLDQQGVLALQGAQINQLTDEERVVHAGDLGGRQTRPPC